MSTDRVSAIRISASAHTVYVIVSDPARHVDVDGSGMLQVAPDARQLTAVGQTFDMDMDRRPLGDIPNMAEYKVRCTVTQLIPDRLIEWTVRAVGKPCLRLADRTAHRRRMPGQQLLRLDPHQRRTPVEVPLARRAGRPAGALGRQPRAAGHKARRVATWVTGRPRGELAVNGGACPRRIPAPPASHRRRPAGLPRSSAARMQPHRARFPHPSPRRTRQVARPP